MVQRFLNYIFLLTVLFSCTVNQNNIKTEKADQYPQLNYLEISWGNCMRYEEPYIDNDSTIVLYGLGMSSETYKYRSKFLTNMYVKKNCDYQIIHQGKVLNGTYRINGINFPIEGKNIIGIYRPEYFIATFKNGKRDEKWEYYGSDFNSTKNTEIIKSLSGNKNYKPNVSPIKVEAYKNGLPDGEWWQKSKDRVEYFTYKSGKLVNQKIINKKK